MLASLVGCQQRTANELLGSWEGRPDSAAARQQREAEKYGDQTPDGKEPDPSSETPSDWEAYDVAITMEFVSRTELAFSLTGDSSPVEGSWKMLQAGPSSCTIEVTSPTGAEGSDELRRFHLELDQREGALHGFLLSEVGADRGLGALYFSRPGASQ